MVQAATGQLDPEPLLQACREGDVRWVFAGSRVRRIPGINAVLATWYRPVYTTKTGINHAGPYTVYQWSGPRHAPRALVDQLDEPPG
jgi:hypothetical protein